MDWFGCEACAFSLFTTAFVACRFSGAHSVACIWLSRPWFDLESTSQTNVLLNVNVVEQMHGNTDPLAQWA